MNGKHYRLSTHAKRPNLSIKNSRVQTSWSITPAIVGVYVFHT